MIERINNIVLAILMLGILASCNPENIELPNNTNTTWSAKVKMGETLDSDERYNTIGIELDMSVSGNTILLSTDAQWLTLNSDTLPSDGYFDVLPEENTGVEDREAEVILTNQADGTTYSIVLVQKGSIGYNDASLDYKIGCGFSCFDEYMSEASTKKCVIDEAKLRNFDSDSTFVSIQEAARGEMYYEYHSAYSLSEMQKRLTEKSTSSTNILGYKKTVERYKNVSSSETNEQYYGYARMVKVVASCSMDEGALKYVLNNKDVIKSNKLPFTDGFYDYYNKINNSSGNSRKLLIEEMLTEYGTHVVVKSSLGGSVDMAITYSRNLVNALEETTETIFKTITGTKTGTNLSACINSKLNNSSAINIRGGESSAKESLLKDVQKLNGANAFSESAWNKWISTISYASVFDKEKRKNLGAVDFDFIPIWEMFADMEIRNEILSVVISQANNQKNIFNDEDLGIDNYALNLTKDITEFSSNTSASLVRVLCSNDIPVAEICNEYVPSIRSDKRITVIYPIVNGVTRITMGLFPGDGENKPAYLSFADGSVYVNPLEEYGTGDYLDVIYYLHGSLYPNNMGIKIRSAKFTIKEHYLQFVSGSNKYPVVKIGSGYWTRTNIKEYMQWGYYDEEDDEFYDVDALVGGYEFAMVYYSQYGAFMDLNNKVYDNVVNSFGYRDKWYVPRTSDKQNLTTYLGRNHKSMFIGQQSGFDAQFLGKCTDVDPDKGYDLGYVKQLEKGQRCYILFKDVDTTSGASNVKGATVLTLKPDYTWGEESKDDMTFYYYPIRCFRTNYYNYLNSGI